MTKSADVIVFRQKDGSARFTCVECEYEVFASIGHVYREPVCKSCEWFGALKSKKTEAAG
jgi:hypothetical protein